MPAPQRSRRKGVLLGGAAMLLTAAVAASAVAGLKLWGSETLGRVVRDAAAGQADGYIPDGESVSPFSAHPAVMELDPELRATVREAARTAEADGVEIRVTSGWRVEQWSDAFVSVRVAWIVMPTVRRRRPGTHVICQGENCQCDGRQWGHVSNRIFTAGAS